MPPLASSLIEALGWRGAYLALAALAVVVGGGMAALIESDSRARGLGPDGDPLQAVIQSVRPAGASVSEAMRSPAFIGLYAACLVCSFAVCVPFAHLSPYVLDHGVPQSSAVLLLGMIGAGSTAGRFFIGGLADRMGRRRSLVAMFVGMALSLIVWASASGFWSLAPFAAAYGVFYGGWVALLPALVMDDFGGRSVSGIIGLLFTSVAFGTLIGPSAAGFAFDISHSYQRRHTWPAEVRRRVRRPRRLSALAIGKRMRLSIYGPRRVSIPAPFACACTCAGAGRRSTPHAGDDPCRTRLRHAGDDRFGDEPGHDTRTHRVAGTKPLGCLWPKCTRRLHARPTAVRRVSRRAISPTRRSDCTFSGSASGASRLPFGAARS